MADDTSRAPLPSPPTETPGPSVTAPELPESETERRERADFLVPHAEALQGDDPDATLLAQQESAAAAEAAAIGGPGSPDADDPAMQPLHEAGQGDQEGWEAAERDLIGNATHSDGGGNPLRDAFSPEAESDRSGARRPHRAQARRRDLPRAGRARRTRARRARRVGGPRGAPPAARPARRGRGLLAHGALLRRARRRTGDPQLRPRARLSFRHDPSPPCRELTAVQDPPGFGCPHIGFRFSGAHRLAG